MNNDNYILIYDINDYPGNGGGTYVKFFKTLAELDIAVDLEFKNTNTKDKSLILAGELRERFKYEPVQIISSLKRDR